MLPPAGTRSMLSMGRVEAELDFTPGVYESMSKKALVQMKGKRYNQHMATVDMEKPSHRMNMPYPSVKETFKVRGKKVDYNQPD